MIRRLLIGAAVAAFALPAVASPAQPVPQASGQASGQASVSAAPIDAATRARITRILRSTPLIDGHNDLPWTLRQGFGNDLANVDLTQNQQNNARRLHTDIPRLRAGGVGGQFWSVYVSAALPQTEAAKVTFEQIDTVRRIVAAFPDTFELAYTADDIQRIHRAGRIASLIGMEGGYSIDDSLGLLRQFHAAGARYLTLTHSRNINWADAGTDAPRWNGLNAFGETVVREMNRLGMMVDLSHVSEATMTDAIRVSAAPVIFSHSSARAVTDHPRNVPDTVLRMMPQNGGVVMITFVPAFVSETVRQWDARRAAENARLGSLHTDSPQAVRDGLAAWVAANPQPRATLQDVVDHIQHVRDVAGVDHVGLGGDFDGIASLPEGIEGVDAYPVILAALMAQGWSDADIRKLVGENILRVMRRVEAVAEAQKSQPPALARLEP